MDMPAHVEMMMPAQFSIQELSRQAADFSPVISIVRQTWNSQTLSQILEGRLAIPDGVVNESLARCIGENAAVSDIKLTSVEGDRFRLEAVTSGFGRVNLLCRIDQLTHSKDVSLLKITVLEKDLPDQGTMSWIVSRVSLSMIEKLVGPIELGEALHMKIVGDTIAVDFHEALNDTEFGKANLLGYRLSDALVIEGAHPKDGYIEFKTSLNMPDAVKRALYNILR